MPDPDPKEIQDLDKLSDAEFDELERRARQYLAHKYQIQHLHGLSDPQLERQARQYLALIGGGNFDEQYKAGMRNWAADFAVMATWFAIGLSPIVLFFLLVILPALLASH